MSDAPSTFPIQYQGQSVETLPKETVLDAILRASISTPFSCKGGSCHTCMLQCVEGDIPERSQRALDEELRAKRYFLPCRCVPTSAMSVRTPQPQDLVTRSMLVEVSGHDSGCLHIMFEAPRQFRFRPGVVVRLVTGNDYEPRWQITSEPSSPVIEALWHLREGDVIPEALAVGAEYGMEFDVRGPFSGDHDEIPEMPMPPIEPELWSQLENGKTVRRVLECFYAKVYADPMLSPFFVGVTMDFIIGKQYSFFETLLTGGHSYFGDTPRNTHHWMVIPHRVFDHRQLLMDEALRECEVPAELAARWNQLEEYFRPDIVKDREWPRRINGELVDLTGFETMVMDIGTICDSCNGEVSPGDQVSYHRRTGRISCPSCTLVKPA